MSLERLVYESTATGPAEPPQTLPVILAQAQRNNARDDLTGVLAAHEDRYFQVVEGPREKLDDLLRRLEDDPRHKDVRLIDREAVTSRMFEGWTMANAQITPDIGRMLAVLTDRELASSSWILLAMRDAVIVTGSHGVSPRN